MLTRPTPPPLGTKLVTGEGFVTPPWANFFNSLYLYQKAIDASVSDGVYTLGLGTPDGEITITNGVITAVQEVG